MYAEYLRDSVCILYLQKPQGNRAKVYLSIFTLLRNSVPHSSLQNISFKRIEHLESSRSTSVSFKTLKEASFGETHSPWEHSGSKLGNLGDQSSGWLRQGKYHFTSEVAGMEQGMSTNLHGLNSKESFHPICS